MSANENGSNIDIGIITIKQEELSAVLRHLGRLGELNDLPQTKDKRHDYIYHTISTLNGSHYDIAVARCSEQGTGKAQSMAADMIEELKPSWLFLVGIAGGVPATEYSLGDVMLCTRLHDFTRCSTSEGELPRFAPSGGPMHPSVERLLEVLPAFADDFESYGWNSRDTLGVERPRIELQNISKFLTGKDESWNDKLVDSLKRNFSKPRKPLYYLGPIGSSDNLVKSPEFLKRWLDSVRDITHIDMELAGCYHVANKHNTPLLSIRALSDVVGYSRSPEWTNFACESAASFAICLIQSGRIKSIYLTGGKSLDKKVSTGASAEISETFINLSEKSPFHALGSIPRGHRSYIERDSDKQLKELLRTHPFICVQGDYGTGKSSLLIRVQDMLTSEWKIIHPTIELYQYGNETTFETAFFKDLQTVDKSMHSWITARDFLKEGKLAFLIDEIGGDHLNQVAGMLIKRLYSIFERDPSSEHVRVILAIRDPIRDYIIGLNLDNPKYVDCWEIVALSPLTDLELMEMLKLFPPAIEQCLRDNFVLIQKITSMKPYDVQNLCDGLWKHLRGKKIPIEDVDKQIESYLKEYGTR